MPPVRSVTRAGRLPHVGVACTTGHRVVVEVDPTPIERESRSELIIGRRQLWHLPGYAERLVESRPGCRVDVEASTSAGAIRREEDLEPALGQGRSGVLAARHVKLGERNRCTERVQSAGPPGFEQHAGSGPERYE